MITMKLPKINRYRAVQGIRTQVNRHRNHETANSFLRKAFEQHFGISNDVINGIVLQHQQQEQQFKSSSERRKLR